ncbi:MAG: ATP-binding cassette domain-containing protein [Firmicutes bacterium]|nr:ATP-binding cassette domain-containing protein [Bacillota bacterium]
MLEIRNVTKIYQIGDIETKALDNVSLKFRAGEFVSVLGPSGCGKTTLLNIIGGLDRYTKGDLIINGKSTKKFIDSDWDAYRNNSVGFVFQNYNLINHISILENVEMGMTLSGIPFKVRREKAIEVLTKVGLEDQMYKRSSQLSGGQKQRVAIARALANDPDVILADEPTGALDTTTSGEVMDLIREISKEKLVVMVTHNEEIAKKYSTRIVQLKDGVVVVSNEPDELVDETQDYKQLKTSMKFSTALKLSFNNLKTKLGRTLITAIAGSIGIIGVALVLAISNGFSNEIGKLETETLSTLPITVTEIPFTFQSGPPTGVNDNVSNETSLFDPVYDSDEVDHYNVFTDEYLTYLNNIDQALVSSIQYNYGVQMLMIYDDNGTLQITLSNNISFSELSNNDAYLNGQFNLVAGNLPEDEYGVVIIVDVLNKIDSKILEFLGLDPLQDINFNDVIGKEIVVANSDDITYGVNGGMITQNVNQTSYDNGIVLSITGVLKAKNDGLETTTQGIFFHDDLEIVYIENNINSTTCTQYEAIDRTTMSPDELNLLNIQEHTSGCTELPLLISIYPESFTQKDAVLSYLDAYNADKAEVDQVLYTDLAATISGIMGSIITNISAVLVAFAAISLVVSSIMIGIITYVSVLERTKEIGILRSLGARKRDISRVFNAESIIIGFIAGMIGIITTFVLSIPINIILANVLEGFGDIAILRVDHALYLITISVLLTFIAGLIPSRIAAKKDPVEALRHNE